MQDCGRMRNLTSPGGTDGEQQRKMLRDHKTQVQHEGHLIDIERGQLLVNDLQNRAGHEPTVQQTPTNTPSLPKPAAPIMYLGLGPAKLGGSVAGDRSGVAGGGAGGKHLCNQKKEVTTTHPSRAGGQPRADHADDRHTGTPRIRTRNNRNTRSGHVEARTQRRHMRASWQAHSSTRGRAGEWTTNGAKGTTT